MSLMLGELSAYTDISTRLEMGQVLLSSQDRYKISKEEPKPEYIKSNVPSLSQDAVLR